jgi:hypothetical protein
MGRRRIGQERLGLVAERGGRRSCLDDLSMLIDWVFVARHLEVISCAAKGEPAWPPLALFRALLIAVWYDLSDVKLAEALDDRASFRRFCGFSASEPTPERTAFVRFRKALIAHGLDKSLFEEITGQLKAKAVLVKTGTLVDATIIASASENDDDARWVKHKGKPAVHGFKAHVGADADTALVEEIAITLRISTMAKPARMHYQPIPARSLPTAPIGAVISAMPSVLRAARRASWQPACGGATKPRRWPALAPETSLSIGSAAGSRRSSAPGSEAMAFAACDGSDWPRPLSRSVSPRSPTTSSEV